MPQKVAISRMSANTQRRRRNDIVSGDDVVYATIVIVDDHAILCEGLRETFEKVGEFIVAGTASDRLSAVRLVGETIPDLVLIDVNIPGSGIETARQISLRFPSVKIVMLSAYDDEYYVNCSLRAGASAYLLKGIAADELVNATRRVLLGECFVSPTLAMRLLAANRHASAHGVDDIDPVELTEREEEILRLIAQGRSNSEIADDLGLNERSVKHYVSNVMQKLHVRNRVEAATHGYNRLVAKFCNDK